MSKSAALSTHVKYLRTRQSIDLKVDALHPQLYLLTPSQPDQKLFSYLPQIFADQSQEVSYAVFINQDNHVVVCDIVGVGDLRKTVVDLGSVIQRLTLHHTRFVTAEFGQALLTNINRKWNITTAVFLNSNFDAMAYLPFDKPVTARRLVKAAIMTNTAMVTLFVPTGQTGLTPNAFQALREQLQHYQIQLVDQITYTGSYNDEMTYDSLLEDWQGKN